MSYRYTSQNVRLVRGDTQPDTLFQILNESTGDPIDLTDYSTATEYPLFTFYKVGTTTVLFTAALVVTDAVNGWCRLDWPNDCSGYVAGSYAGQVQLTTDSGATVVQTVDRHLRVTLIDAI